MKFATLLASVSLLTSSVSAFGTLCGQKVNLQADFPAVTPLKKELKLVFFGDAGSGTQQKEVLTKAKNWGAEAIIHSGDFEYENDAALFEQQLNAVLGPDYPYFASIGNHDVLAWRGHQSRLEERLLRFGANCTGEVGVNMACNYGGVYFVLSGVGTRGDDHEAYVDSVFNSRPAIWKFVSWHKNQRMMQIGGKFDETGWNIYETTRVHGAIAVTGHEHNYCRSHTMSSFEDQVITDQNNTLNLKPGQSFVFVSGLGGKSIRDWNDKLRTNPWWAVAAASDNGVKDGALFCTFNIEDNERLASCFFEDTTGKVWDTFRIFSHLPASKEELQKAVRAEKEKRQRKNGSCKRTWVELTVSRGNADVQEDLESGELVCGASVISFARGATAALRFEGSQIPGNAKILQARLQVYGAVSDEARQANFVISGALSSSLSPFSCSPTSRRHQLKERSVTKTLVSWETENEDWEAGTVWVSPDLREIVEEIQGEEGWRQGGKMEILMAGRGEKGFFSFDESSCLAPTLAVEYEEC